MPDPSSIADILKEKLGSESILDFKAPRPRRAYVTLTPGSVKDAIRVLVEVGFKHLSTITGMDTGSEIEVIYHLGDYSNVVSLRTKLQRDSPELPSCTDLLPGASLYEREVHDLVGVTFKGHPGLSPLVLPEGWPPGLYPLRKDCSIEDITRILNASQSREGNQSNE